MGNQKPEPSAGHPSFVTTRTLPILGNGNTNVARQPSGSQQSFDDSLRTATNQAGLINDTPRRLSLIRRSSADSKASSSTRSPIKCTSLGDGRKRSSPVAHKRAGRLLPRTSTSRTAVSRYYGKRGSTIDLDDGDEIEPLGRRRSSPKNLEQVAPFWEGYNKAADFEDREFVKALGLNLDTLLIFAGLFSGVNTAFILESLKTIQPDSAETANNLIRSVILVLHNSTTKPDDLLYNKPFQATSSSVRCTTIFFASLCCSLSAAFGAVIGKQWLNYYEREGGLKPPADRARERQKKYEGRQLWHLEGVIETLPTILQLSLFLFLLALVDFLWPINKTVALVALGFSIVPVLFYTISTMIAAIFPASPFQTRLSLSIRGLIIKTYRSLKPGPYYLKRLPGRVGLAFQKLVKRILPGRTGFIVASIQEPFNIIVELAVVIFLSPLYCLRQTPRWVLQLLSALFSSLSSNTKDRSKNDLSFIGCLIFYMKRASSPEDLSAVLDAVDAIPADKLTERNHPVVASFVETMLKFLLKPSWDSRTGMVVWGTTNIDFQPLLKTLHLIYVQWESALDFSSIVVGQHTSGKQLEEMYQVRAAIGRELWSVFSRDPLNIDSVSLISALMEATKPPTRYINNKNTQPHPSACSESNLELLCQCLQRPSLTTSDYLPYMSLLSYTSPHQLAAYASKPEFYDVSRILLSGMWDGDNADLDFRRGCVRAVSLPLLLSEADNGDEHSLCKYLLHWCTTHSKQERALSWYLHGISTLLQSKRNHRLWPHQLEEDGHPPLLLHIMHEFIASPVSNFACHCFVKLWRKRRPRTSTVFADASYYLSPSAVATVLRFWIRSNMLTQMSKGDICELMEYTVAYLEEASRLGLLVRGNEAAVKSYKLLGERYLNHDEEMHQRLDDWYQRMESLTFI